MRRLLVLTIAALAALTACKPDSAAPKANPLTLMGRTWVLQDVGGEGALAEPRAVLIFAANGRFRGHTGCNAMMGEVRLSGDTIAIPGPVGTTRMACAAEAATAQEQRYTDSLTKSARWAMDGEKLLIFDAEGNRLLQFAASAEAPAE
jgi:heat shock protein HslJ